MAKKVLLAEDHSIVIKGVKIIFETEIKGYVLDVVKNSSDLLKYLKHNSYELAIIDLQLEDGDTFHMIGDILELYPHLNILVFTANPEEIYAKRLFKAGVKGYLNKLTDDEEINKAIRHTLSGNVYMSENFKSLMVGNPGTKGKLNVLDKLSPREMEVANLLKMGKKTSEICAELNVQSSTVATYKLKIFEKLGITNPIELKELFKNHEGGGGRSSDLGTEAAENDTASS
ncbi:MAG: response regulator transcription factor [Chitinophagaceae bacterium]